MVRRPNLWLPALLAAAIWTILLLVFATQYYVTLRAAGQEVTWLSQLRRELPGWAAWAILSPAVFQVARRLPIAGGTRLRTLLLHPPAAVAFFGIYLLIYNLLLQLVPLRPEITALAFAERMRQGVLMNFATFFLIYAAVLATYYMLAYGRAYREKEVHASQLEASLTRARLDALRMQLQPHFLFNTLHGISALMARDAGAARRMIADLSDLLRYAIDPDSDLIPLAREAAMLERYLAIQRTRFGERLTARVEIDPACHAWPVPRFMLQPLVENAIQHGISGRAAGGCVVTSARPRGDRLEVRVCDDGPGFADEAQRGEGVGLGNTRDRLATLYGKEFEMTLNNRPTGGARVTLLIPRTRDGGTAEESTR